MSVGSRDAAGRRRPGAEEAESHHDSPAAVVDCKVASPFFHGSAGAGDRGRDWRMGMTASLRRESEAALSGECQPDSTIAAGLHARQDQEVELKLDLDPSDVERLVGSAFFAGADEQDQ